MVSTKILSFYIFFLIIFSSFVSLFAVTNDSDKYDYKNYLVISKFRDRVSQEEGVISKVLNVVAIPFLLIDALIFPMAIIGISFAFLPTLVNVIFFTPLGLIVIFEYVMPYIRGN